MKPYIPAIVCSFLACAAGADSGTYESEAFSVDTTLNLDVAPKSCNWQAGSITIKWTSVSSSVEEIPTYTVYWASNTNNFNDADFFDESKGNVHRLDEVQGLHTGSMELTYTDEEFCKQGDGTQIIYYCVKGSDGSRGCCATRRRFGLFVGFTKYTGDDVSHWIPSSIPEANDFWNKFILAGGTEDAQATQCLWDNDAKCIDVDKGLSSLANRVKTGDVFIFYCLTHGVHNGNNEFVGISCIDGYYPCGNFKRRLDAIGSKGVATISILGTCGSGQIARKCGNQNNKAWITATKNNESAWGHTGIYTGVEFSYFGLAFLDWGWERGLASKAGVATYYDLANYAESHVEAVSSSIRFYPSAFNEKILKSVVAYNDSFRHAQARLSAPKNLRAQLNNENTLITVVWDAVEGADYYRICWHKIGEEKSYWINSSNNMLSVPDEKAIHFSLTTGQYEFSVTAINSYGYGYPSSTVKIDWESKIDFFVSGLLKWYYAIADINATIFKGLLEPAISAFTLGDIEVPNSVNGANVVALGAYSFYGCNHQRDSA